MMMLNWKGRLLLSSASRHTDSLRSATYIIKSLLAKWPSSHNLVLCDICVFFKIFIRKSLTFWLRAQMQHVQLCYLWRDFTPLARAAIYWDLTNGRFIITAAYGVLKGPHQCWDSCTVTAWSIIIVLLVVYSHFCIDSVSFCALLLVQTRRDRLLNLIRHRNFIFLEKVLVLEVDCVVWTFSSCQDRADLEWQDRGRTFGADRAGGKCKTVEACRLCVTLPDHVPRSGSRWLTKLGNQGWFSSQDFSVHFTAKFKFLK